MHRLYIPYPAVPFPAFMCYGLLCTRFHAAHLGFVSTFSFFSRESSGEKLMKKAALQSVFIFFAVTLGITFMYIAFLRQQQMMPAGSPMKLADG